ncbi:MAG: hypothetical protein KC419_04155, partial [Anaerolineales bacterium]|nr:hypothetical protein [Anaerolineales bacterium]
NPHITRELRLIGQENLAISVITQAELYFGALNKNELSKIKSIFHYFIITRLMKQLVIVFYD